MTPRARAWSLRCAAVATLVAIWWLGMQAVQMRPGQVAVFWPGAGLAIGLLAIVSRRRWPVLVAGVLVSTTLANLTGGRDLDLSIGFGLANTSEAVVAAWLLRGREDRRPRLESLDDVLRLCRAGLAGAIVAGLGIGTSVELFIDGRLLDSASSVFASHGAATLVMVPVAIAWTHLRPPARALELLVQSLALAAVTVVIFSPDQDLPLAFAPLPLLVWAALRFDLRVVSLELLAVSVLCIALTVQGLGPFGGAVSAGDTSPAFAAAMVQIWLLSAAVMTLPLTVAIEQRRHLVAAVTASERLTGATLDTTAALILLTDTDGTVVRANRAATTLTGWSEDDLVGKPLWEHLVAPDRIPAVQRIFSETGGLDLDASRETDVPRKDGQMLRMLWSNDHVRDDEGRVRYAVLTGVDVTAERRALGTVHHLLQVSTNTVLVGLDADGSISMLNSGARRMLRREDEEVVGRPFTELLDPVELEERTGSREHAEVFAALLSGLDDEGETPPRDWTVVGADGSRHTLSLTLSVTTDVVSGAQGYLCVGQDVTERRTTQEMLIAALDKERMAVERLRKLDAAKNEFVSTVSHELRTPITSIVGYTEMLEDGAVVPPAPEQLPLLATIARNGARLIAICNDLLMLGGLDSGQATWDRERFDLRDLLPHLSDAVRSLAHRRVLDMRFSAGDEPLMVLGDRQQLERVLLNLLSNAVKFSEDDGLVECTLRREGDEAVMSVRDTGIGIPEEEQAELFTRFFRSSTAQQRAIPGTGLGLSIVSGIVAAHGGRVSVESAHLEGTTFTVQLPISRGA